MKLSQFFTFVAITCFLFLGVDLAFAQAVDPISSDSDFIQYVLQNILTIKSMGPIAIALFVSKAVLYAFNTPTIGKLLDRLTGKVKLVVTMAITYVIGVLTLMVTKDVSLAVALFDSANIPLLGLLLNQIYKQFFVKADEPPKVVA